MTRSNGAALRVGPVQVPEIGGRVAKGAGDAAQRVAEAVEQRVAEAVEETGSRVAKLDAPGFFSGAKAAALAKAGAAAAKARRRADAAAVRLQLANTSRELAHETSDLGQAVESLNAIVVRANRKTGAAKRRRLFVGIALGAGLAYHLDPAEGRQRRAATVGMLTGATRSGLSKVRAAAEARRVSRSPSA